MTKIGCGIIIVNREEKTLLLAKRDTVVSLIRKSWQNPRQLLKLLRVVKCKGMFDLLGGHVEDGEAPATAIIRELSEEITIDGKRFYPREYTLFDVVHTHGFEQHIFTAECPELNDLSNVVFNEGLGLYWLPAEQVLDTELAFDFSEVTDRFIRSAM